MARLSNATTVTSNSPNDGSRTAGNVAGIGSNFVSSNVRMDGEDDGMSESMMFERSQQGEALSEIRFWLIVFMAGLVVSGITAFPLQSELSLMLSVLQSAPLRQPAQAIALLPWITRVHHALSETNALYPFLAYRTDWLAFAHVVLAFYLSDRIVIPFATNG